MFLIVKRDGTIVPFDRANIIVAINSAMKEVDSDDNISSIKRYDSTISFNN